MKILFLTVYLWISLISCSSPSIMVKESIGELQIAVASDSNSAVAHYNLGLGYTAKKDFDSAITAFETAIELEPSFAQAHFGAYCTKMVFYRNEYEKQSEDTSSLVKSINRHLEMALLTDPFIDWRVSTILLSQTPGSYDADVQELIDAIYEIFYSGFREFALGNYETSVAKFNRTIEIFPKFGQCYLFRGLAHAQLQRFDSSRNDLQHVIDEIKEYNKNKIVPVYTSTAQLHYFMAFTHLRQNNLAAAEDLFKKALTEELNYYMAHAQLANIYMQHKQFSSALQEIDQAIFISPEDPVLHYNRGIVLTQLRQFPDALASYQKAIELQPRYCKPYFNAALLAEAIGRKELARSYYTQFIARSPKSNVEQLQRAAEKIEKL